MLKKSIFTIFITLLFCSYNVKANDEVEAVNTSQNIIHMPACSDVSLISNIKENITKYYSENPTNKPYLLRKRKLVLNSLNGFYEVGLKSVNTEKNPNLARAVIMTKINSRLDDSQMKLCKAINGKTNLYALINPKTFVDDAGLTISIFGASTVSNKNNLSFEY